VLDNSQGISELPARRGTDFWR